MRINNNITALNTFNKYTSNTKASSGAMEKLSSGFRINRAADDAAGLSISEKMRSQIAGLNQSKRNVEDGISYIQTAEGALEEVSGMLVRMKELAVEASNGTYSAEDLSNIQAEVTQLSKAVTEIAGTTKFNGIDVFGTATTIAYGANATESVVVAAATGFTGIAADSSGDLAKINVTTDAAAGVTTIESAINTVNTQRATYGSQQNKLTHIGNNLATTNENITAAESNIRDVDMAAEMSEYTKNNILVQASTAMLAQANAMPQNVLSLLQ